jgi:hypothetical protein
MPRGGKREGAGRKFGSKTMRHASFRDELWHWCKVHRADPYKFLAKTLADSNAPLGIRVTCAKELASYLEPKLASVTHHGQVTIVQKLQNLQDLSDAELDEVIQYAEDVAHGRA